MRSSLIVLMTVSLLGVQSIASAAPAIEAPTSLAANAVSETRIDLTWKHSGSGITGFLIERSLSAGNGFSKIASTGSSARSYNNTGLSNAKTYYYRIRAYKQKGRTVSYSSYTSVASATTLSAFAPGAFEFSVGSYSANEGAGKVDIVIKRVGGADGAVTVDWRTKGVSATYAQDYGDFSWTTLNFADGEASKALSVSIVNDTVVEGDEVFDVLLSNPTGGATLGTITTAAVTIEDDDTRSPAPSPSPSPSPPTALGYLPVFPGAQGFGAETTAGRGGQIIKVTNLNDSGSGSLRAALEASGPRIVVFEVSGTISLSSHIKVLNPYLTIAGQTAPSPGITLKGGTLVIGTHDVLIQHIRSRSGDQSGPVATDRDAWKIASGSLVANNVVLDHVTGSWGVDETLGIGRDGTNITLSNSIFSEGLQNSIHPEGSHSMGVMIYDDTANVSMMGNLMAHCDYRMPVLKGNSKSVILNNVMYNVGSSNFTYLSDSFDSGPIYASIVGNVYIKGPDTNSTAVAVHTLSSVKAGTKIYLSDNKYSGTIKADSSFVVSSAPIWHSSLSVESSSTVEASVLANAGARPADRDSVDERIVNEVKSRTGRIIDSQSEVGGWPNLARNVRVFVVPADPNGDDDDDGYTNIEEILHQMAAQVEGR